MENRGDGCGVGGFPEWWESPWAHRVMRPLGGAAVTTLSRAQKATEGSLESSVLAQKTKEAGPCHGWTGFFMLYCAPALWRRASPLHGRGWARCLLSVVPRGGCSAPLSGVPLLRASTSPWCHWHTSGGGTNRACDPCRWDSSTAASGRIRRGRRQRRSWSCRHGGSG